MLYTLSQAHYDTAELTALLNANPQKNAVLLWQDGVLQAVKNPQLFANCPHCFVLAQDVAARGLTLPEQFKPLTLAEFVALSEQFYPQIAL